MHNLYDNNASSVDELIDNHLFGVNCKENAVITLSLPPQSIEPLFNQLASIAGESWVFCDQKLSNSLKNC